MNHKFTSKNFKKIQGDRGDLRKEKLKSVNKHGKVEKYKKRNKRVV